MRASELKAHFDRLVADGNGDVEVIIAIDDSGQGREIIDVDLFDEPVILTASRTVKIGSERDLGV